MMGQWGRGNREMMNTVRQEERMNNTMGKGGRKKEKMQEGQKKYSRHYIADILYEEEEKPLDLTCWGEEGRREGEEEERLGKKKLRTTFSGWQIFELERIFETRKYINCAERKHLSR